MGIRSVLARLEEKRGQAQGVRENFVQVLKGALEYKSDGHDFLGVLLEQMEQGTVSSVAKFCSAAVERMVPLEEALATAPRTLSITDVKIVQEKYGDGLSIKINGKEYRYVSDEFPTEELYRKFTGILKHSAGRALQWLKKNSICYYGSKKSFDVDSASSGASG